jgi:type II secretory pathway pseudopilin PulG
MNGFSLIEALCALGILATSLLTTAGLLVTGARQIASAGRLSVAQTVTHSAVDELAHLGFERALALVGCNATQPVCEAGPGQPAVDAWRDRAAARIGPAEMHIKLESLDSPALQGAVAVRISASLSWTEGPRARHVQAVTIRG